MKLTTQSVAALSLAPGKDDQIWFDDTVPGFGLRLRQTGGRSWIFQYKIGRATRRLVIGSASAIKVGKAREIAGQHHAAVRLGRDPAAEKRTQVERASHTFAALVEKYLDHQRNELRPASFLEVNRHLVTHSKPLHALPVDTVDHRIIAGRLAAIEKSSGAVAANRVRATMSAMFTWGMREGLVRANPVMLTNKRQEKSRDRVLTDNELRLIWKALGDSQYGAVVRLLMLTAQRAGEIAGLRWDEVDFERNVISLPGRRTKNGRPHEIPMAATTRALLEAQPRIDGRDFVFGKGSGPFSGFSRCKNALDAEITKLNHGKALTPWVLHDVRRSAATRMADIGVAPHIIEAVLNHVSGHQGGVAGIYNRATYAAEKAQALAIWDEHVAAIVHGRRRVVMPLRGRS